MSNKKPEERITFGGVCDCGEDSPGNIMLYCEDCNICNCFNCCVFDEQDNILCHKCNKNLTGGI